MILNPNLGGGGGGGGGEFYRPLPQLFFYQITQKR